MSRFARISLLVLLIGILAACGAFGASTPTETPTASPTAAPPVTTRPTASPTSASNVVAQPPVTGTFTATVCCPMTLTVTASDARVSGTGTFELKSLENADGTMAWEWGNIGLSNDGGSWDGSCRGGGWDSARRAEVSCWLAGQGAYQGLTYFEHLSAGLGQGELYGMILPVAAPVP